MGPCRGCAGVCSVIYIYMYIYIYTCRGDAGFQAAIMENHIGKEDARLNGH